MRIACISDLHISDFFSDNCEYVDDILYQLQNHNVNHLVICGDIVGTYSDPRASDDFEELRRALKYYDWYDPWRCTIVSGNHDARWLGNFELAKAKTIRQIYPALFRADQRYNISRYIITKMLRSCAIIGLDTATDNGPQSFHTGLLGDDQLEELKRLQNLKSIKERYVILVMHHVPQSHNIREGVLRDANDFWDIVDPNVIDLIVCGHIHENREYDNFDVPVVCVGGFLEYEECLLIEVDEEGIDWAWLDISDD